MRMHVRHWPGVVVALSLAAGCWGGGRSEQPAPAAGPGTPRYPHTEADVRFMSVMIAHHAQAVRMARLATASQAGSTVSRLAERIASGQRDEIATMQQWLRDRGQPVPEVDTTEWTVSGHAHPMPGMATEAELARLGAAKGADYDRLFLTLMIRHHRGAVAMVKDLFGTPGAAQDETVFKFANDVQVDQSTEIARMERLLSTLPAGGRST
jgi:uncharacterized protein (DUF305 family)